MHNTRMAVLWMLAAGLLVPAMSAAGPRRVIRRHQRAKVNTRWEAKADKNKDGVVQPREAHAAKVKARAKRSVVNRPWEKAADTDNNGLVSPVELRSYHRKVMDRDNDGIIDKAEAAAIREALGD